MVVVVRDAEYLLASRQVERGRLRHLVNGQVVVEELVGFVEEVGNVGVSPDRRLYHQLVVPQHFH